MPAASNPVAGRAFRGDGGEERGYRAGVFLTFVITGDGAALERCRELRIPTRLADAATHPGVLRASGESINTAGGFLAPTELQSEILSLRDLAGVFRRFARVLPMGSDNRSWPRRTGGYTASFIGENSAITESAATFDSIGFNAKKLAAFVRAPSELTDDEAVGLAAWVAEELAYGFADKEDACGFTGDGTSTYSGIRGLTTLAVDGNHNASKYTAASGHNTFATLDAVDLAGWIGTLPEFALPGAAFYVSNIGAANLFYRLAQTSGAIGSTGGEPCYLGFPIRLTPKLPAVTSTLTGKAMAFFGDLRLAAALGNRRGVTIATSDRERYLENDQVAVRGTERMDVNIHDLGDGTKAGPLVALVAP